MLSSASPATPATACSSPATGSRTSRPSPATTSRRCPTSPQRSAPRRDARRGRAFQLHFADHDIFTPGDALDVLVAMNPAALKREPGRPRAGGIAHRRHARTSPTRNLNKAGYRSQPPGGRLASTTTSCSAVDITKLTCASVEGSRPVGTQGAARAKNLFALGLVSWLYQRPIEATEQWIDAQVRRRSPSCARPTAAALRGRLQLRRDDRGVRRCGTRSRPAPMPAGTYRNITGNTALALRHRRRGVSGPACRCSSAATRSRRRATSCTSCRSTRNSASRTFQAEDEIAGIGAALGAAFGGAIGVTDHQRPRHRAEVGDDGPGGDGRAAADRHRRPARRPVDRPAHEDRAGGPAAGDVRPQRRGAAADRRARSAGRLLRRRRRGGPHRDHAT